MKLNFRTDLRRRVRQGRAISIAMLFAVLAPFLLNVLPAVAATTGSMIASGITIPHGAVFLPDATGGHWWVGDTVGGVCRLDSQAGSPPFKLGSCPGGGTKGGQLVVGDTPTTAVDGTKYVYAANAASKSVTVTRYTFTPAGSGNLSNGLNMLITNLTAVGGGSGGGRPVGLALAPNGQDLYVGYLKSGDIMRVTDVMHTISQTPPQAKIGSTSDGRGINALVLFGNDLYIAEVGGFGLSKIADPSGVTRPACSAASPCTSATVPNVAGFPGGLATNGKVIYIGDAPPTGLPNKGVIRYNPATGVVDVYSTAISPSYVSNGTTYNQYIGPLALGVAVITAPGATNSNAINGDLLVGDDPQFMAATPINLQGHFWKAPVPVPPTVTVVSPNNGVEAGGDAVTISGTGFAVNGAPTINFGANPGTNVSCANDTTCTVTSPAGTGVVDVTVTAGGLTSALTPADTFTYIPVNAASTSVQSISPTHGGPLGETQVTITGTNLATVDANGNVTLPLPTVNFGLNPATNVACTSATTCTVTSPAGTGVVDVIVTLNGVTSAVTPADRFTYTPVAVQSLAPNQGTSMGGTSVTITGSSLALVDAAGAVIAQPTANFGLNPATNVACISATTCTVTSPAGTGVVDVIVIVTDPATGTSVSSAANPNDKYTYLPPTASLYAWGITAPKGGAVWLPNSTGGGHWWSSDHAQGLCRQDPVPNTRIFAINFAVCASDLVGSAGQAVYDPRANANGTHYVYVPDNAVKSTAVWRLTFDPVKEVMVPDPLDGVTTATAMTPLADVRTLKPNGMALGPDGNLYVTDLVEPNVRRITNPNGDPRTQVISIVAVTGDNRGSNGTQGFIGNLLYISGNRATQFIDITQCPIVNANGTTTPCGMASVPAPSGIFVAGTAVDPTHKLVYLSDSPGGAGATIYRYDASKDVYVAFAAGSVAPDAFGVVTCPSCTVGRIAVTYVTGGNLPGPSTPEGTVYCALTCQRPWDQGNHPTTSTTAPVPATFSFVFGLGMEPNGTLVITEDPSAGARSGRGTMWTVPYIP